MDEPEPRRAAWPEWLSESFPGVKADAVRLHVKQYGTLRAIALVSTGLPMTNYTPDLQPLSIGMHSKTLTGRGSLNFLGRRGLYLNGAAAYTFRSNVTLDRPYYYTNGQIYLSNEVAMPNVFDYSASVGYYRHDVKIIGNFAQQQTRGGGDIRRQDMPFISNRMNFSAAGFEVQYPIPHLRRLQYWIAYRNVFDGRNVGQANTITTGLMYTFHRERQTNTHDQGFGFGRRTPGSAGIVLVAATFFAAAAARTSTQQRFCRHRSSPAWMRTPAPGR